MLKSLISAVLRSLLLLLLSTTTGWGQTQLRFEQLTVEQGFSQSIVYQIAQDTYGNLWATTEEGVVRFNSRETYSYNASKGLPIAFGESVRAIHIGKEGTIWVGGERGVARFLPEQNRFELIETEEFSPASIKDLYTTEDGTLWVAGFNGLWSYSIESGIGARTANVKGVEVLLPAGESLIFGAADGLYLLDLQTEEWKPTVVNNPVSALASKTEGYLIGTKNGKLLKLDRQLNTQELIFEIAGLPIRSIEPGPESGWYVAIDGAGIQLLDKDLKKSGSFRNDVDDRGSISSDGVYDLLLDNEGILWVATYGGGINKLDPYSNTFRHLTHVTNTEQSLTHPFTRTIMEDEEGRVWFGTKKGISVLFRDSGKWRHLLTGNVEGANHIVTALVEQEGHVWATTFQGQLFKIDKQNFTVKERSFINKEDDRNGRVFSATLDTKGSLWLGGINMDLYQLTAAGGIKTFPIQQVKAITLASDGRLLVGSRDGLKVLKSEEGTDSDIRVSSLKAIEENRKAVGYTMINTILPTMDGMLYLGTNGAGIVLYNQATEEVTVLTTEDGLPSNSVQTLLEDQRGAIWAGTARGLFQINGNIIDPSVQVYTKADGLLSTEFNSGSAIQLKDGTMLFGGLEGVSLFNPQEVNTPSSAPTIVLEELYLFNERQLPGSDVLASHINTLDKLELTYDENALTFHFTGVTHAAAGKVRYRWQLSGLNDRWSEATELNQINFTNLEPGKYVFRVQATINSDEWGEVRELPVIITPPWWKTWWAYLSYAVLVLAGAYVLFRISRGLIRRRNAERQIDFFNNITHELKTPLAILLASLEDVTETTDRAGAETNKKIRSTVKRLNALFEQLLNFHKASSTGKSRHIAAFIPGERLRELTTRFTPLLKERGLSLAVQDDQAPPRFHYDIDIFDKIVFNLVSNAVKYSQSGGSISVELGKAVNGRLVLKIADTGIGIPAEQQKYILREYYRARNAINSQLPGTGLGLMMVKSMVEKEGGSIRFISKENVGTTFTVEMEDRKADLPAGNFEEGSLASLSSVTTATVPDTVSDADTTGLESAQILLVEDNDELRASLAKRLSNHFRVITASDGKAGLEKAAELFPDLIITDLIMPEMDGMELSRAIQADIQLNHIPIYMLTVLHNSAQKVQSIEAGVTEYLEKPVNFDLLLAKITNTLSWRQRMRQRYAAQDEAGRADLHRTERESEFIGGLEKFMLDNLSNDSLSVQDLCRHIGMSRTSLYMKMKNLIDFSPQDFIIHTRLKESRRLLTETNETVKGIAYDCGFSNPKYFSTSFKKKYGMSPVAFRKSLV